MKRTFVTFAQFAAFTKERARAVGGARTGGQFIGRTNPFVIAAEVTSFVLHANAVRTMGDNRKLAHLAKATQDERERLGFTPDDPLVRDGRRLRDHIERFHYGLTAAAGSSDKVQAYHEWGYINARTGKPVPARPVFDKALQEAEPLVDVILAKACGAALGFAPMSRASFILKTK